MKTTFLFFALLLYSFNSLSQELINDAWLEDLEAYQSGLEQKHIDVYNKISKAHFDADLEKIRASLSAKTDLEITLDLMRLTRKIGDGHTAISLRNQSFRSYPFGLQNFTGDWRVVKVDNEHANLLGMQLESIDNVPIEAIAQKVGEVAQFVENEQSQMVRTGENLTSADLLYGLRIAKNREQASFVFSNERGEKTRVGLNAISREAYDEATLFRELEIAVPEIKRPENPSYEFLWYAPIDGTDGLYIHFESYPKFEEMMAFGEELVGYIFQHNIRQLVIDMRNNGGGDLYTGLVLAYALNLADPVDWKSGVYVLCDKVTFSAATSNTALFRELLNATIVGEPTGSNPTGYQDMDTFELPNSKLVVCYSKRFFRIQESITHGVQPDIPIEYVWESFSQGNDNMLEWVVNKLKAK